MVGLNGLKIINNMIYVIESNDKFKVGYSGNWETRKLAYDTHNPDWNLKSLHEGNALLEEAIRDELKPWLYKGEWFIKFEGWYPHVLEIISALLKDIKVASEEDIKKAKMDFNYLEPYSSIKLLRGMSKVVGKSRLTYDEFIDWIALNNKTPIKIFIDKSGVEVGILTTYEIMHLESED